MSRLLFVIALFLVAFAALAAERTFPLVNWLERDWPRMLLHYDITGQPGEWKSGKVQVLDPVGEPVPCQLVVLEQHKDGSLKRGRLSYYAELPKGGNLDYRLVPAPKPAAFPAGVAAKKVGAALEVSSAVAGVRIPAPGGQQYKTPVAPATVPAPILGYRLSTGQWAGKGWLESDRQVAAWSQRVVADGPLYKEYAYEVRFAPEGYYKVRVRVEAEEPLVYVAEEYDMKAATRGKDLFVLALNEGWKPDTALWACDRLPAGKQVRVRDRRI